MKRSRKLALALFALVGILSTQQAFAFFGFFDDDNDHRWRRHHGPYGWNGPHGWGGGPYGWGGPHRWGGPYGWGSPYGYGYPGYGYQNNTQGSEPPPPPPLPE